MCFRMSWTKPWKVCNLLGGLLILIDLTNAGMIPINSPDKGRPKPMSGSIISNTGISRPMTSIVTSNSGSPLHSSHIIPPKNPNTVQAPIMHAASVPSVPSVPTAQIPSPQAIAQVPSPALPSAQSNPNSPPPVNLSQRPPNYVTSTLGTTQSHATYSHHSGGANPVVVVVQQTYNESLSHPEPTPQEQILTAANSTEPQVNLQQVTPQDFSSTATTTQVEPEGIDHLQTVLPTVEAPEAATSASPTGASQTAPVIEEEDETPQFNLEAYLAQANLVLSNNANYYSPPPTAQVTTEYISQPAKPTISVSPIEVSTNVEPITTLSAAGLAGVTENLVTAHFENISSTVLPATLSLSTNNAITAGESVVHAPTAGSFGNDVVHVTVNTQTSHTQPAITPPHQQETIAVEIVYGSDVTEQMSVPGTPTSTTVEELLTPANVDLQPEVTAEPENTVTTQVIQNEIGSQEVPVTLEETIPTLVPQETTVLEESQTVPVPVSSTIIPQEDQQHTSQDSASVTTAEVEATGSTPAVQQTEVNEIENIQHQSAQSSPSASLNENVSPPQDVQIQHPVIPSPSNEAELLSSVAPTPSLENASLQSDLPPTGVIPTVADSSPPPQSEVLLQPILATSVSEGLPPQPQQVPPNENLTPQNQFIPIISPVPGNAIPSHELPQPVSSPPSNNQHQVPVPLFTPDISPTQHVPAEQEITSAGALPSNTASLEPAEPAPLLPNAQLESVAPLVNAAPPPNNNPSNIIFEGTISSIPDHASGYHPDTIQANLPNGNPQSYVVVPLNIPPDTEGTLTISAKPVEQHHGEEAEDEEYPPFNVEQYLAQAALFLGSPSYSIQPPESWEHHQPINPENFQSSIQIQHGDTDAAIHIIPPPSLLAEIPDNQLETEEVVVSEPISQFVPLSSTVEIGEPENIQLLVGPDLIHHPNEDPIHIEESLSQTAPVFVNTFLHVSNEPLASELQEASNVIPETVPLLHNPVPIIPLDQQGPQLVGGNVIDISPLLLEGSDSELADDSSLLGNSALEALEAESDSDINDQNIIPVYLLSVPEGSSEEDNLILSETILRESYHAPSLNSHPPSEQNAPEKKARPSSVKAQSVERARPMRPIASLGLLGRPSTLGIAPMHTYSGNKLNQLVGSLPMALSEDGKLTGTFSGGSSKNQNNGSVILHDNRNPQNGMVHLMGNTVFNSHVSGDKSAQFTVPANAHSFIMAQSEKLPFNFSPPFESLINRPPPSEFVNNVLHGDSSSDNDTPSTITSQQQYNGYYNSPDSVRNYTALIHNGMMRPLISPVFLVVNTNPDQGTNSHQVQLGNEFKVVPEDASYGNTNNLNSVNFPSDNAAAKENQNNPGAAGLHLVKRTATKNLIGKVNATNVTNEAFAPLASEEVPNYNNLLMPLEDENKNEQTFESSETETYNDGSVGDNQDSTSSKLNQHKIAEANEAGEEEEDDDDDEDDEEEENGMKENEISESPQKPHQPTKESPKENSSSKQQDKDQSQKVNPSDAPMKDKQTAPNLEAPPPQQAAPPRAPPPKEGPSSSGPSLPQPPPVPSLIGPPMVPEALSIPGGLGEITIPEPNINAPNVPVPTVTIPTIPKPMGDTKGLGKGPSAGGSSKTKPNKKPPQNSNPPKGNTAQQPSQQQQQQQQQQPTNIGSGPFHTPQQPVAPAASSHSPLTQYHQQQEQNEQLMEQLNTQSQNYQTNEMNGISSDDTKYYGPEEEQADVDSYEEVEENKPESIAEALGVDMLSIPSIPQVPNPLVEKALPGKYGTGGGGGKPSAVPSLAAFSAPYVNSQSQNSNANNNNNNNAQGTQQGTQQAPCTCSAPNAGNSNGNNNANSNSYNNNPPSSGGSSGGKNKPAPPQAASQVPDDMEVEEIEHTNVRPPRPNKPKRPNRPNMGSKKPRPKPAADKLKDTGDEEENSLEGMKLVAVLTNPQNGIDTHDITDIDDSSKNEEDAVEDEVHEVEDQQQMLPIKLTFVNNKNDTRHNALGGPIKVTFVSTNTVDNKTETHQVPIRVTFINGPSEDAASEREQVEQDEQEEQEEEATPSKITVISNNSTKENGTDPEDSLQDTPLPGESVPLSTPEKQSEPIFTTVKLFGWDIPTINWNYFTDMFGHMFGKNFRTTSGEFTCDEADDESPNLRTELDVDYLCGGDYDFSRMDAALQIDSNICNMFCASNGFYSGVCMPQKSCLCYMNEEKSFAIKLDRLQDYNNNQNQTEKVSPNSANDPSDNACQNCRCLKSCQNHGKYVGYCSKSCHCGVPWHSENPDGKLQSS